MHILQGNGVLYSILPLNFKIVPLDRHLQSRYFYSHMPCKVNSSLSFCAHFRSGELKDKLCKRFDVRVSIR